MGAQVGPAAHHQDGGDRHAGQRQPAAAGAAQGGNQGQADDEGGDDVAGRERAEVGRDQGMRRPRPLHEVLDQLGGAGTAGFGQRQEYGGPDAPAPQ
jgi:hypothetical protein